MSVKKYVKKPIAISAMQWDGRNGKEIMEFCKQCYTSPSVPIMMINTLEGPMRASEGDYIIRGIQGEFYACKPDIFKATYEEIKEETKNQ